MKFENAKRQWAVSAEGIADPEEKRLRAAGQSYLINCHIIAGKRDHAGPLLLADEETDPCLFVGLKGYLICALEDRAEFTPTWRELWRMLLFKMRLATPAYMNNSTLFAAMKDCE